MKSASKYIHRLLATTLSLLIVGTTIPAYADNGVADTDSVVIQFLEGSLSNSFTKTLTGGGHVVDGVGLTAADADTFDITLPAGASVDMALFYWDVMDAQADVVEFESTDVIPGATTFGTVADPCWAANTSTTSYRADVTSLVPGTGMYDVTISKAADQNSVLGAALVVIYKDDSASTVTTVLVDDGHIVRTSNEIMSHTMTGFSVSDVPISATTSFIVGDSQSGTSDETFETNIVGDASAPNGPRFHTNTANVLAFVSAGMTEADLTIESAQTSADCLTWIVQVFDFSVEKLVVGGEFIPIDSTALILANTQSFSWMIPVILSVLGIGLFVVSRKPENS